MLFARYTCPVAEKFFPCWSETDATIPTMSGRKVWHTPDGLVTIEGGQALLQKKWGGRRRNSLREATE